MRMVQLLNKQIPAQEMGFCSVHEHIIPKPCLEEERDRAVEHSLQRLQHAYDQGVRTVVDVSPWARAEILEDIVQHTPMQLVGCTGFYLDRTGELAALSVEDYVARMMRDVEYGLQGTDLQPGVIKVASAHANLTPQEQRVMIAAGMVQRRTGLPVCVHSIEGCLTQQKLLLEGGADPARLYFCHVEANQGWEGRSFEEQMEVFAQVTEKGSYLCMNNFGNWSHTSQDCMAALLHHMIGRGYGNKLLATMDYYWYVENNEIRVWWEDICENGRERDCAYLVTHVQPWLRSRGVGEKVISAMNRENPAALFG